MGVLEGYAEVAIFDRFPQIYCVDADSQHKLIERLEASDVHFFLLDGSRISDIESFYKEAAANLPLDPPLIGTACNWDAFTDALWEGLANLEHSEVVIIWTDADRMVDSALHQLIEICLVVNDVIRAAAQESTNIPVPVNLALILLGNGKSFSAVEEIM